MNTGKTNPGFKTVILGESSCGKSSIALRFVKDDFNDYSESTIGAAFVVGKIEKDDKVYKFEIWDTAGQERYHSLAPMYYRGAKAAVIVFDITKKETFECAKRWVDELNYATKNVIVILSGNKCDLNHSRDISTEEAQKYADQNGLIYLETSAKENINIHKIFESISEKIQINENKDQHIDLYKKEKEQQKCCFI